MVWKSLALFVFAAKQNQLVVLINQHVLFGILFLVYLPTLDPYSDYTPIGNDMIAKVTYDELPRGDMICPERSANIFSRIIFSWLNPPTKLGYERRLNEKDIWKLDTWE